MFKTLPLHILMHGHDTSAPEGVVNVRLAGREDGIDQLAASIHALGLLLPLTVVPGAGQAHYVVDGNRRLAALRTLACDGRIRTDAPVAVIECDAETARERGLSANITQSRMHQADEYRAFHAPSSRREWMKRPSRPASASTPSVSGGCWPWASSPTKCWMPGVPATSAGTLSTP
ncbi:hypothetical protein ABIC20_001250 [Methylobacterium radiotolerans]|uniref:ParB-like N-terminal domain-containing protein n=1 Tax=Methylobacterium radiotolerans TaxID=31998 RepID=A0ABV2NBS0_9HYPH